MGDRRGPPWYDRPVYETIRGGADLLARSPDSLLEARIGYIDRIIAAQALQQKSLVYYSRLYKDRLPGHSITLS